MKDYYAPMHTAEHILNQTMVRMFNCERSFSNHIEKKKSKCDYHFDKALTEEDHSEIERRVNEIISQELEVKEELIKIEEAKKDFNLEKLPDSSVNEVRVVHVGDYDSCLCIGKHVSNTREISTFKIVSSSYENEILRIRFKLKQ